MELTKKEVKSIQAYDGDFGIDKIHSCTEARGQEIADIIVFSLGRRSMHDSGYPFLRMIGRQYTRGGDILEVKYFDLGWHDHFICYIRVNIDSFGKNLFRIMPWAGKTSFKVSPHFLSCSTFQVGCMYPEIQPENTLS